MLAAYEGVELRAIAFKVIIEPLPEPERIVHVVKNREDSFRMGRVLSIGKIAAEKLPDLRVGEKVLYAQSVACTNAARDRHIVSHDHVLAVVIEEDDVDAELLAWICKTLMRICRLADVKTPLELAEEAADLERLKAQAQDVTTLREAMAPITTPMPPRALAR